jgi:hypothetical protein
VEANLNCLTRPRLKTVWRLTVLPPFKLVASLLWLHLQSNLIGPESQVRETQRRKALCPGHTASPKADAPGPLICARSGSNARATVKFW